jgi:hypothetical protein
LRYYTGIFLEELRKTATVGVSALAEYKSLYSVTARRSYTVSEEKILKMEILRYSETLIPDYTASHPRRQ